MNHAETKRPVSRIARLLVACALVAIAGSCRSPVSMSGAGGGTADFSIRFLVSGTNRDASRADPDSARPRLVLPTADTLTVTLTATDGGGDPIASTSAISGTTSSVYFGEVPFGSYEIRAEAFGGGAVRFRQVSTISVAATDVELTLNLLPTDAEVLETVTQYSLSVAELAPDASMSWGIPTGSGLLAADSLYVEGLVSDCHVFLQDADGRLLGQATASGRLASSTLPKDRPAYLTFYNGGSEPVTLSAFAGPAMVDVPAGTFQRDATVTNTSYVSAFSMGKHEVTREQYMAVMGNDPSSVAISSGWTDPVQQVSWYGAIAFCNRLSVLEGMTPVYSVQGSKDVDAWGAIPTTENENWSAAIVDLAANGYRLPTEMEWMWAAMGATEDRSNGYTGVGTNIQGIDKLFAGSNGSNGIADYANINESTRPVGELLPNELGLYDMSGNVYEWCCDRMGAYPDGSITDYSGAQVGLRMTLGGSWGDSRAINYRYSQDPSLAGASNLGFRVARSILPLYSVTYDGNGATSGTVPVDSNAYQNGSTVPVLANTGILLKTGSAFAGWNTRADGTGVDRLPYGASVAVGPATVTLYAKWLSDFSSANIGSLKAVPVGSYQRDSTVTNITRIRQAYRMSVTEITRAQWTAVTGWPDPVSGFSSGTGDPVQNVNWYHAIAFCNRLSIKEGLTPVYNVSVGGVPVNFATLTFAAIPSGAANADWNAATADWSANGYRLPTEMEWVWAAMGATSDARIGDLVMGHNVGGWSKGYAGSTEAGSAYVNLGDYAWYDLNCVNPENKTHPAGVKTANELGFYDMSGNVCEWMWDPYYGILPTGMVDSDSAAGRGLGAVTYRVKTGGSWNYYNTFCAVGWRLNESPWAAGGSVGFRVVRP